MDFESVARELYGAERAEFTPLRDRRAKEARDAREKDLAKRIGALRKPTSAAWLVNRLARERPGELGKLGELGEALRQAHSELAGDELRALSRQKHDLVRTLTELAVGKAGVGESVVREVSDTLEAALADPGAGDAVAEGRLTSALQPGSGFSGDWMATGPATGPAPARPPKAAKAAKAESRPERKPDDSAQRKQAQRKQEERERERRRKEELKQARAALSEARSARDTAASELRAAERAEAKARKRTETARKELDEATRRLGQAEEDVEKAS